MNNNQITFLSFFKILAVAIIITLASCSSSEKLSQPAVSNSTGSNSKNLTEEQTINLRYLYVNAVKEKLAGNLDKSVEMFLQCIRIDGTNHAAMYEIALIKSEQNKLEDALFFARSAAELDKNNLWYQLFLSELYVSSGENSEAEKLLSRLHREHPDDLDLSFKYAAILLYNGKYDETIKVYDQIEQIIGINPDLISDKERLYLKLGKTDKAAIEVEKLIAKNPAELKYYSMLVELYQITGDQEKAYEAIQRMQAIRSDSPYVYLALAEYYRSGNQKQKSFEQLKLAFGSIELDSDVKIKIISSYLPLVESSQEMLGQAVELSSILAETHSGEAVAQAIYGDFLVISEKYTDAKDQYLKSIQLDDKNFTVWQQLFYCYSQLGDYKEMLEYTSRALDLYPEQSLVYMFHGIALAQNDRHSEAIKVLTTGSKLVVDNDAQLFQFYSSLGDSYNELKDYIESDKNFEKALKINPDDPFLLNNYSYYLSLRGEKLEKAEEMSKRSNDIQPGQASFEDTYAWILYRLGKYEEAKQYLQKALDHGGESSGTILEHMGDVLFQLGDTDKAVEFWINASKTEEASEFIEQKIRDKKLYE